MCGSPPSLGDHFPTRIRKDVSGGILHCFLLPFSTLPLNKKGMSLHETCNSMHSPCNLHKRHATPCMRHATPCIRHAPCKLMHAPCTLCMKNIRNWIGSKQLNQSYASIIKVFDLCLATAHVIRNHCAVELLHPCTLALAVNSDPRSSIRHCHFDLPASLQLIFLLLCYGHLIAKFNSWDPHHLNESCP